MRALRVPVVTAVLFCTVRLFAQEQTAKIEGSVRDGLGAPLRDVRVEAVSEAGLRFAASTDASGQYRLSSIPPGRYGVTTFLQGNATSNSYGVVVRLGETARVDFTLQTSRISESIVVTARTAPTDLASSALQAHISSDAFEALPRGRDFTTVATFAPGATEETKARGISIHGSSGAENRYVLDGVDVTDPEFGTAGKTVLTEFVDDVQVKLAGYEAEYGGATGGVINAVSRTGTNQFRGAVGTWITDRSWGGDERPVLVISPLGSAFRYLTPPRDRDRAIEPGIELSGPIRKENAWFFGAYVPTMRTIERPVAGGRSFSQEFRRDNISANATATVGSRAFVKASTNQSRHRTDDQLPDPRFVGDAAFYDGIRETSRNLTYAAYADLLATLKVQIRGYGGRFGTEYALTGNPDVTMIYFYGSPAMFPEVPPELVRPSGYFNVHSNVDVERDDFTRDTLGLETEVSVDWFGTHAIKSGVQFERLRHDVLSGRQQPAYLFLWGDSRLGPRGAGRYGSIYAEHEFDFGRVSSTQRALFLQDGWSLPRHGLVLNAGVRAERETIPSYTDPTLGYPRVAVEFGHADKLAPRLGVAWDVRRDGRTKLYASYGSFFDRMKLSLARRLFGGSRNIGYYFTLDSYDWPNVVCTGVNALPTDRPVCSGARFVELVDLKPSLDATGNYRIDPDLKPMESREWLAGAEHAVSKSITARVTYVHKELVRALETVGIAMPSGRTVQFIANPGFGIARDVKPGYPALPRAVRDYDALEFALEMRSGRSRLHASYLFSRLWGNYPGIFNSDENWPNRPYESGFADQLHSSFDARGKPVYGRLPTDRPHQVKVQWSHDFHWGTSIGVNQYAGSGTPISREMLYRRAVFFPDGRGSMGRTPALTRTDLLVRQMWRISQRSRLEVSVNVLNLFDSDTPVSIYQRYSNADLQMTDAEFFAGFDPDVKAANLRRQPFFGRENSFQPPREIRVGFRLAF